MVKIREIFSSIQGEGPFIGYKQLFVRLCSCNLNCEYCDTEFDLANSKEYSVQELLNIFEENKDCHSVSFTGGEPLISIEFLKSFLPYSTLPVYLETNATLYKNLAEIIEYIDYISADIKLPSSTGLKPLWDVHDEFFKLASEKVLFAKMVFGKTLSDFEIEKACELCKKYNIELVLQPKMLEKIPEVSSTEMESVLDKCLKLYKKTRLIPQVHKFLDVQ